jgi:hypothetical protein
MSRSLYEKRVNHCGGETSVVFLKDNIEVAVVTFCKGVADNYTADAGFEADLGSKRILQEAQSFFDDYVDV